MPQLTKWEHVMNVVTEADTFSREEIQKLRYQLEQLFDKNLHFGIGIKRLLDLIDLSRQVRNVAKAVRKYSVQP